MTFRKSCVVHRAVVLRPLRESRNGEGRAIRARRWLCAGFRSEGYGVRLPQIPGGEGGHFPPFTLLTCAKFVQNNTNQRKGFRFRSVSCRRGRRWVETALRIAKRRRTSQKSFKILGIRVSRDQIRTEKASKSTALGLVDIQRERCSQSSGRVETALRIANRRRTSQ